uniref:Uncharacterized protein n=1 Tax=Noccaea caerulescens TaxID=107243 RepID=A0A1J3FYU5_NOCCA
MTVHFHRFHPETRINMIKQKENISFRISGMIKLTITIATSLVICSVLLRSPSNIFNRHKSHLTTTGNNRSFCVTLIPKLAKETENAHLTSLSFMFIKRFK